VPGTGERLLSPRPPQALLGGSGGHELVALARSVERGGEYRVMRAVELAGAIAALAAGAGADDQAGGDR